MNIQPVKTDGVALPPKPKAPAAGAKPAPTQAPTTDRVEIESQDHLVEAVRQEPATRAGEVERAQALINDPDYPSKQVLEQVARRLLGGK